jgi:hypothetical protein
MSNKARQIHKHVSYTKHGGARVEAYLSKSQNFATVHLPDSGAKKTDDLKSDIEEAESYQRWGTNNDKPTKNRQKLEASSTAWPLIWMLVELMWGKGIRYGFMEYVDGKPELKHQSNPDIDKFLTDNDVDFIMMERLMDFKVFNNLFCEFILSNNLQTITEIGHVEAEFTRFGEIKNNRFQKILVNANWQEDENNYSEIPFLERRDKSREKIQKQFGGKKKFAFHDHFPSPGRTVYAIPKHEAILKEDGWLDYANSIPEIMNKFNKQAKNIRYHVEIPVNYWESRYKDWGTMKPEEQDKRIDEVLSEMDDWFSGAKGNDTFYTHFEVDHQGKYLAGWKLNTIDLRSKAADYLTSLQEADVQISRAIGADSSMPGIQPEGGKMGGGSGSDKRVGFTNSVTLSHAAQRIILNPLYLVAWYNGWGDNIRFWFEHDIPTTLNENKNGVKNDEL